MSERSPYSLHMYFVPRAKIKPALEAMQTHYQFGFSWIKSCDYLADENKYAVLVAMTASYPFLENDWKRFE